MSKAKKFIKTSAIYFVGQMATKLIAMFLLPLYSNKFSPEQFGYFDLTNGVLSVIVPLFCLEIWSCVLRFIFDYKDLKGKYKIISNGLMILLTSISIYSVLFFITTRFWSFQYSGLMYLYGFALMFSYMYGGIARGLQKNITYMISGVIGSTSIILINIILIVGFNIGVETLFISGIISSILQVIIIEFKVKTIKNFKFKYFDKKILKQMVIFSYPLCINTVAFWLLTNFSRIPIVQYLGEAENGIFAMASRFAVILSLFVSIFNLAWQEMTFSMHKDNDRMQVYSKGLDLLLKVLGFAMILLLPFTKLAFTFLNQQYSDSLIIIPLYFLGTLASSYSAFLGNIFSAEKKNTTVFTSTIIGATLNVIIIYVTINIWGLQGVCLGLFLGFLATVAIRVFILNKKFGIKINYRTIVVLTIFYGITTLIFYLTGNLFNAIWLVFAGILSLFSFREYLIPLYHKLKLMIFKK